MSLANSAGWALYRELLDRQAKGREGTILYKAIEETGQIYAQEFMKGEVSGIYTSVTMLEPIVDGINEEIESRKFEENKEDA